MKTRFAPLKSVVHHGNVTASALLFDLDFIDLRTAQLRILGMWKTGSKVFRLSDALVLLWPKPMPIFCNEATGLPLTALDSSAAAPLSAVPLTEKQIKQLRPPYKSLVRAKHGAIRIDNLDTEEDPACWFNLEGYSEIKVTPPKVKPSATTPEIQPETFNPREHLHGIPPAAPALNEFMEELRRENAARQAGQGQPAQAGRPGELDIGRWFRSLFGGEGGAAGAGQQQFRTPAPPQRGTTNEDDMIFNFRMQLYRLMSATGIADLFHKKQAAYMYDMLDKFERGDWNEALRHAIPLSKDSSGRAIPSLGIPMPRNDISLNFGPQVPATSAFLSQDDLYERMRRMYRNAFERLEAAGKIDEAAFVLAELLSEPDEAMAFLEKHKRFETAAKLAEARELRPEAIVRLWILANNPKRAMLIARKSGCFAEAVQLLKKEHPDLANALRTMWASHLADSGDYARAAMVANTPELAHLSLEWTKLALEIGDPNSGQLLANWLIPLPSEEWPQLKEYALRLLDDESRELAPARLTFTTELAKSSILRSAEAHVLMRAAIRASLADSGRGYVTLNKKIVKQLLHSSNDAGLQTDAILCKLECPLLDLSSRAQPINYVISENDVGINKLYDCSQLKNGNLIVAMGEAGVCLLNREGRTQRHFAVPADRLVVSQNGDRVIAIANRGDAKRLTRIDLLAGKAEYLGEAHIDVYADTYDGSAWYAAKDEQLFIVDALANRFKVLWIMPNVVTKVTGISAGVDTCSFVTSGEITQDMFGRKLAAPVFKTEIWRCDVPGMILRRRTDHTQVHESPGLLWCSTTPAGDLLEVRTLTEEEDLVSVKIRGMQVDSTFQRTYPRECGLTANNKWLALTVGRTNQEGPTPFSSCFIIDIARGTVRAQIDFNRTLRLNARIDNDTLTLCDDLGRVVTIDLNHGAMSNTMRI